MEEPATGSIRVHEFKWSVLTAVRKTSHPSVLMAPKGVVSTIRVFLKSIIQTKNTVESITTRLN